MRGEMSTGEVFEHVREVAHQATVEYTDEATLPDVIHKRFYEEAVSIWLSNEFVQPKPGEYDGSPYIAYGIRMVRESDPRIYSMSEERQAEVERLIRNMLVAEFRSKTNSDYKPVLIAAREAVLSQISSAELIASDRIYTKVKAELASSPEALLQKPAVAPTDVAYDAGYEQALCDIEAHLVRGHFGKDTDNSNIFRLSSAIGILISDTEDAGESVHEVISEVRKNRWKTYNPGDKAYVASQMSRLRNAVLAGDMLSCAVENEQWRAATCEREPTLSGAILEASADFQYILGDVMTTNAGHPERTLFSLIREYAKLPEITKEQWGHIQEAIERVYDDLRLVMDVEYQNAVKKEDEE